MTKLVKIVAGEWFDIFHAFGFIAECDNGKFVTCSASEDAHGRWSLSSFGEDGSMIIDQKTTAEVHEMLAALPSVSEWEELQ